MSSRRPRGDGGPHWDQRRQRWVATATVGYDGRDKRIVRHSYGRTKTEAKAKLRDLLRSREDGVALTRDGCTVRQAVEDWLEHGLSGRDKATRDANRHLCEKHVLPYLGARKLRDLTASEVDEWLATLATSLSTRTLQGVRACLNRAVRRAMARDKVKRNVVELTEVPAGIPGRPSKAMTAQQADDLITKTASDRMHSYVLVSLLTGARTEELRALRWEHVHLEGRPDVTPPIPPFVEVWRSVRAGGDTKTRKSRRTIALPDLCISALVNLRAQQDAERRAAGEQWHETGLVFTTRLGTAMDAANVRRDFRRALASVPGLNPEEWTPRELRHSFVSLLSDAGVPIEDVSRLVGHSSTSVTELSTGIRSVPSSKVVQRSWIGSSVRRPTVALPRVSPPRMPQEPSEAPASAIATRNVSHSVSHSGPVDQFECRVEMCFDKAEHWSG